MWAQGMSKNNWPQVVQLNYPGKTKRLVSGIFLLLLPVSCQTRKNPKIAFIPMTTGSTFWEAEHAGAEAAARKLKCDIYWNAPAQEDDVESQVALLQRISAGGYQGLVLAPDHALALLAPVRRAVAAGIPTVVIVTPLALPPSAKLSYIITDEEEAGRMVGDRLGSVLHGKGSVAVLGVDPDITGIMLRLRSLESHLEKHFPAIRIVARGPGAFNAAEAQQATFEVLSSNSEVGAVLSLTAVSTRAAFFALKSRNELGMVKLLGCDQDLDMLHQLRLGGIDSVLAVDTYRMGYEAVRQIAARIRNKPVPDRIVLAPLLVTRENVGSRTVQDLTDMRWFDQK
jgi:ribose transport system substrate-binding protein